MKSKKIIAIFILFGFSGFAKMPIDTSASIDMLFKNFNKKTAGYSIAVIKDGEVIYKNSYGMADIKNNKPISSETSFDMASLTKQFIAMCILLLEEQGKLSINDDIRKYIPEIPSYGNTRISIEHLLIHSGGFKDGLDIIAGTDPKAITRESFFKQLASQKSLNFIPGQEIMYSNTGYDLLGIIIERASGISFKDFAHLNIFKPLGMINSQICETPENVLNKNRALGYSKISNNIYKVVPTEKQHYGNPGSSGLYSTIDDMILWEKNFDQNQLGNKSQVLINRIKTKRTLDNKSETNAAYGLFYGWSVGRIMIGHDGGSEGFSSISYGLEKEKLKVICLSNIDKEPVYDVLYKIFKVYYNAKEFKRNAITLAPNTVNYVKNTLKEKEGIYYDSLHKLVRILSVKNDTLQLLAYPNFQQEKLYPVDSNRFELYYGQKYKFHKSTSGNYFHEDSLRIFIKMTDPKMKPDFAYEGIYKNAELGAEAIVKIKNGKLWVELNKKIKVDIQPIFLDAFTISDYNDYIPLIIFERDHFKKIKSFNLSINEARNLIFEKVK